MFPTTITINNISDLQKVMSVLYPTTGVVEIKDTDRDVKPAKAEAKPKKTEAPAEGNAAPAASTETTAAADAPEQKAVTYAELQASVLKLHKLDSNAAKPIAEGMGFPNFKAMPDDKWAEALGKVEAALAQRGV